MAVRSCAQARGEGQDQETPLPWMGFETLADLCGALLQSCMARDDFDPPFALLLLTGSNLTTHQKWKRCSDLHTHLMRY
jgi:hypothetical protein